MLFAELMRRHESEILKKCYLRLKNRQDAQDVSQEVLIRLFTRAATYQPELPFKPWLGKIIQNRCNDHLNNDKTALREEISARMADRIEEEINTDEVDRSTPEILQELLEKAGGSTKSILMLKYGEGYSIQQIQQVLGLKESAVKQQLKRAREKMRKLFAQYAKRSSAT